MVIKYLALLLEYSKDKISKLGFLILGIGASTLMVYLHGWPN
jgi:hypothetical protein